MPECVKVVVRVRPLNAEERARGCVSVVSTDQSAAEVTVTNPKSQVGTSFAFNAVFGPETTQQALYDQTVFPLVESVLQGYNGTVFAYGQTGCGKTFTMTGDSATPGVTPNSFNHLFGAISDTDKTKCFLVRCSYMEIYNEEIRDLLKYDAKMRLELKENKDGVVFVKDLTTETVASVADMNRVMEIGARHRTTKETMMNERSSRSHAIFTVYLEMSEEVSGRQVIKAGKLNLVDLAGSERQRKTQAVADRLREAIEINLSLSALGNVISALIDSSSSHIPYRDSKLTRLLQDSLGGNTKTIMIAVVSPADYNAEESLSTLRYASRAKRIQNKPRVNEDPKDALLREYAQEIAKLKRMLAERHEPVIIERIVEKEKTVETQSSDAQANTAPDNSEQHPRTASVAVEDGRSDSHSDDGVNGSAAPHRSAEKAKYRGNSTKAEQYIERDNSISHGDLSQSPLPRQHSVRAGNEERFEERKASPKRRRDPRAAKAAVRSARSPVGSKPQVKAEEGRKYVRFQQRHASNVEITDVDEEEADRKVAVQIDVLAFIKEKLITGGQLIEETDQERLKEYHRLQLQLQSQKDREAAQTESHQQHEADLLLTEKQYHSLPDEVQEQRHIIQSLRAKYKSSLAEIEDLSHEREVEKGELLESVRAKDRELAFYRQVAESLIQSSDLTSMKQRSKYDEDNHRWVIPSLIGLNGKEEDSAQKLIGEPCTGDPESDNILKQYQWLAAPRPAEIDNRPPTSGQRSRHLASRHSRNVLLDPIAPEKSTPLVRKKVLRPLPLEQTARAGKKLSDIN